MRIAFIQSFLQERWKTIPLGLLSLASYIKQHGHQPIIIDFNILSKGKKNAPGFFKQLARKILNYLPQVLGFSVMCDTLPTALLIAKECKNLSPKISIIFGGAEVSFDEIEVLKNFKQVDIIVRGEGEITLTETLNAIEKKTPLSDVLGITFRENNKIIRNLDRPFIKNLDDLPYLNFSLLPHLERYEAGQIEAGRGCPFHCTFCAACQMWKRNFRIKSPQRLVYELRNAYRFFKKRVNSCIVFIHDNFLFSQKTIKEFLSLTVNNNLPWACSSRFEALNDDLIKKLKRSSCRRIFLGIESASPKIQKEIKKNLSLPIIPQVLKKICQSGIAVTLSFIIGFPNETKFQINKTLLTALRVKLFNLPSNIRLSFLRLLKGSELYFKTKEKLKQGHFQIDLASPFIALPAELSLIKKYPHIFPSFYRERNKIGFLKFLEEISILFGFLIEIFPLTTLLLLKYFSSTPLQFGQKIISFFDSEKVKWSNFKKEEILFCYYSPFLKKFIERKAPLLIKEIFVHEGLFQQNSFTEPHSPRFQLNIKSDSLPKIARNVKIKAYNHDILSLINNLKTKQKNWGPKIQCHIAYIPGQLAKAVQLSPLSYALLSLCNGKKSIREIISQCLSHEEKSKKASKIILEKFRFFQKEGIISVSK